MKTYYVTYITSTDHECCTVWCEATSKSQAEDYVRKEVTMETQLNKIFLRGIVGNIKVNEIGDKKMARFTLATNYAYKSKDGCAVIQTTWPSITAWERPEFPSLDSISKGDALYIEGRLNQQRYTDSTGHDHTVYEVIATKIECVSESITMEM